MKFARLLRLPALSLSIGLLALPAPAGAKPVRNGAVQVELVAAATSIQPGQPFWVALKLNHDAHWHSYWINAGTGYPTSVNWTLPAGYTAGPIVWPAPHVVKDTAGKVTGNGYEGEVFLFTQITPPLPEFATSGAGSAKGAGSRPEQNAGQTPGGQLRQATAGTNPGPVATGNGAAATGSAAPGTSINLQAATEWLMCKDVCMPGDAKVSLTLPVSAQKTPENTAIARLFNNALSDLPTASKDWIFTAQRAGAKITLRAAPAAGNTHKPAGLHYFDENALVDYAAAQAVREENGAWVLELAADAAADAAAPGLKGVLVASNGFKPASGYGGILVDVKFGADKRPQASAVPGKPGSGSQLSTLNSQPQAAPGGLLATLFLAFAGGIILNLMPCVFPVLGIKILGFVNQSGNDKTKIVQHGLVFTAGVLVSFWVLAGVLLVLRAGGAQLGWGFQLQSPAFVFGMAVFLLIFALNLSGLFEIGLAATGVGGDLQMKEGFAGSFFTGALATLVATPCSAPFLAPALGAALSLSAFESILVFTAIAIGLALPYLLLSIFPSAIRLLPRPGAWMETFKQLMAFPLYATVGWLLWVLAGQTKDDDSALLSIAFGFVLVAMAAWAYGRFGQAHGQPGKQMFGRVAAAALLAAGLFTGWPKTAEAAPAGSYQVTWEKWSPEAIAAAQAAGRYVYVDFTARWCATCQTNKATVFHNDAVLAALAQDKVVLLRADWTNRDPKITAELARWNRSAVPFNLIYSPGKPDPVILPELITPDRMLAALAAAKAK